METTANEKADLEERLEKEPLNFKQVELYQKRMENFARTIASADSKFITQYIEEAKPQYDGTLDKELSASMSEEDMYIAKTNMKFFCELGELVLQGQAIIKRFQEETDGKQTEPPKDDDNGSSTSSNGGSETSDSKSQDS